MRAQITVILLSGSLAVLGLPTPADAQAIDTPTTVALRFFEALPPGDIASALRTIRPPHISADERARVLATLPEKGELQPEADERAKLAALEPVLVCHERHLVLEIKVVDVPQAMVGIHGRAVVLLSRPALRLLSAPELQAVVAHEIGHEYFWSEYEDAHLAHTWQGGRRSS